MSDLASPPPFPLTIEEFLVWDDPSLDGNRFELYDGVVVQMAPERISHAEVKTSAYLLLRDAIGKAHVPCRALIDAVGVPIGEKSVFIPDGLVYCGPRLPGDENICREPIIVVEVVSPGSDRRDQTDKLIGYFSVPSVQHYLVVLTERRMVVHHRREAEGGILTKIIAAGDVRLDPPGLSFSVAELFAILDE